MQSVASSEMMSDDDDESQASFGFDICDDCALTRTHAEETDFIVLSSIDLANEQESQIGQIADLFTVSRVVASALLRAFHWKVERCIEAYYEDEDAALAKAGLADAPTAKRQRTNEEDEEVTCPVCFCDSAIAETSALRCGHRFCNDCWRGQLTTQVGDGNAEKIKCMAHQCTTLVDPSLAQALLDGATYAKFARFAQRQFVDDSPYLKYCPAAGCDRVLKVADLGRTEAKCSCGMIFCFKCSREVHFPMSCSRFTMWEDRIRSDAADGQWMQANARRCPKCHTHIEKNGGCNWISCRCGHQFCYFCYSSDPSHHGQPCNAPPLPEANAAQDDLAYFMHYYDRYDGHRKSEQAETALRDAVTARMEALLSDPSKMHIRVDVEYMCDGAEALIACRRLLKNTYPFAFYMPRDRNSKAIFEHLQARLEGVTEKLAGLLEAEGEPDKRTIIDTTADARQRLKHMVELFEASPTEPTQWGEDASSAARAGKGEVTVPTSERVSPS